MELNVTVATHSHFIYAQAICKLIEDASQVKGTGIAIREVDYIIQKMNDGNAFLGSNFYFF